MGRSPSRGPTGRTSWTTSAPRWRRASGRTWSSATNPADTGAEPHALDPVWASPGGNPVTRITNYVVLRLTNRSTRTGLGTLKLYSTPQGGAASRPGWTFVGQAVNTVVGTGGGQS